MLRYAFLWQHKPQSHFWFCFRSGNVGFYSEKNVTDFMTEKGFLERRLLNSPESSYCLATRWPFAVFPLLQGTMHCWTSRGQRRGAETCSGSQKTWPSPLVGWWRARVLSHTAVHDWFVLQMSISSLLAWDWLAGEGMTSSLWRRWGIRMQCRAEPLSIVSTKQLPFWPDRQPLFGQRRT